MKTTIKNITNNAIYALRALITFILCLLIVIGSVTLLVLQVLAWPFAQLAKLCIKATTKFKLAGN